MGACGGSSVSAPSNTSSTRPATVPFYDVSKLGVPKFVNTVYIDLTQIDPATGGPLINQISRFRSSAGHDYSDSFETCRSMKHYFSAPNSSTRLSAPVAGTVVRFDNSGTESQIAIQADAQPAFWFTIFHLVFVKVFAVGEHVMEGQYLGTHVSDQTSSDMAVLVNPNVTTGLSASATQINGQLVSYFDTLTDSAFAAFRLRGISAPSSLIITQADRDAHPLSCTAAGIFLTLSDPLPQFVRF
jgi:hypothetical protein